VNYTVAYSSAISTSPLPENEVRLFSSWFVLSKPLTPGDTIWAGYRFTGLYFKGSDTTGTFDYIDSVRTVVR
jgi:hypothetical protein